MEKLSNQEIQAYLYEHIPLSKAMEVGVAKVTDELVILTAPIQPNINHRSTVFGGSATTLAILSAWTLINFRLQNQNISSRLVIQKNTMNYDKPIINEFKAICSLNETEIWGKFVKTLQRKNKSRITVNSFLECEGEQVGEFTGVYVGLGT